MPTTSDYLTQLQQDREDLIDNLETQGIDDLTGDETFTELVPRVLDIEGGGDGETPRLPSGYQEVEYIESTGTQYINTGYIHKSNTRIVMNCNVLESAPNSFSAIFGARKSNYNYNNMSFFIRFHAQYNPAYCRSGAETGGSNMIYNTDITVTAEGQTATWTDNQNTYSITTTGTANDGYNPMFLFNINTDSGTGATPDTSWSKMKLYSCVISEDGTEMRNFVPCYRKSDDVIGLYDLVNDAFYINGGTGTFNKGNNVGDSSYQSKSVTIASNTTTTIEPDTGYEALSSVEVITNVTPNLQNKSLTINSNTTTTIEKDSGYDGLGTVTVTTNVSGDTAPTKGYVINNWNADGYPTEITTYGYAGIPSYFFHNISKVSGQYIYLISVFFNNQITNIGGNAFQNCSALALTSLPNTITTIYGNAFQNCSALALTSLPTGLTSIGNYAFAGCTSLALSTLPSGITSIGTYAFQNCSALALTSLPSGITSIGTYTFNGCTNLALTSLPSGINTIGNNAFQNCTNLALTTIEIDATNIGTYAFQNCTNMSTDIILKNLTLLNNYTFDGCSGIKSIKGKFVTVQPYALRNCSSLSTVFAPFISTIGNDSFVGCTSLTHLNIPTCQTINQYAFSGCNNLISVNALRGIKTLANTTSAVGCFQNCTSLERIWIGSSITTIGRYTFAGCTSLTHIYIDLPRTAVQALANYQYAFMNDTSKTEIIICNDDTGFIDADTFDSLYGITQNDYITNCDNLFASTAYIWNSVKTALQYCKPTTAYKMFNNNTALTGTLDMKTLDVSNCTRFESMFEGCTNVDGYDFSNWNTSSGTNMQSMFIYYATSSSHGTKLDLSSFDTSNVTNMSYMFYRSYYLEELDISNFDFTNITTFNNMFSDCGTRTTSGCKVYVKDSTAQNWVLTANNAHPSTWSTSNVIIAGSEDDLRS